MIVDEVHTLARDKRGAHLALSLERLDQRGGRGRRPAAADRALGHPAAPRRGGPTCWPGSGPGRPPPDRRRLRAPPRPRRGHRAPVVRAGGGGQPRPVRRRARPHRRARPRAPHHARVRQHPQAGRAGGPPARRAARGRATARRAAATASLVAAHHGSLSTARRRLVEARLRAGDLRALVATASLELGIDVGPVELVCQIGSPRAIATFLQRVGRANHQLEGTPAGRLYPLTRDELVECTALLAAVRAGTPRRAGAAGGPARRAGPAAGGRGGGGRGVRTRTTSSTWCERAAPVRRPGAGRPSTRSSSWCRWGITTGRGRRGAHLHRDGVHGRLRPRRGARLAALTSGGAIPETGDYRVVLDPDGVTVGSVHEDFAVEANIGDVFLLGTHSWRVRQVEVGTVRVHDAGDAAPTVPFWLGEAPARTAELSEEVGALREAVEAAPRRRRRARPPGARCGSVAGVTDEVADQVVAYLAAGRAALGVLPTPRRLVVERFFDESEGTQLVVHAPYGGRVNRALGLALRKRFCVSFDFELQAAADDDTVLLSLGPQHSFPLTQVPAMLSARTVADVLTQAVLPHPMLQARWRWNCNRALVVPRSRGGQRRPIHLQRMDADDLLAAAWPALAACQENADAGPIAGPRPRAGAPDGGRLPHRGARRRRPRSPAGGDRRRVDVEVHFVESAEPSVLAHGILTGRPYTFLDGAPLEERRSRAVPLRRGLGAGGRTGCRSRPTSWARSTPRRWRRCWTRCVPARATPDELHDLLLSLVALPAGRRVAGAVRRAGGGRPGRAGGRRTGRPPSAGRAAVAAVPVGGPPGTGPDARPADVRRVPARPPGPGRAGLGGGAGGRGPAPPAVPRWARRMAVARARTALARLEAEGSAIQLPDGRWCARHLLVRLHARQPVPPPAAASSRPASRRPRAVPGALAARGAREPAGGPGRRAGRGRAARRGRGARRRLGGATSCRPGWPATTRAGWTSCASRARWPGAGSRPRPEPAADAEQPGDARRGSSTPSPATPLALVLREDLGWLLAAVRGGERPPEPAAGAGGRRAGGPADAGRLLPRRARPGRPAGCRPRWTRASGTWWPGARHRRRLLGRALAALGPATAGGPASAAPHGRVGLALRRADGGVRRRRGPVGAPAVAGAAAGPGAPDGGPRPVAGEDELAEAVAWQLLARWGVVAWELWARGVRSGCPGATWSGPCAASRPAGSALGGRFVAGLSGEQYATPGGGRPAGRGPAGRGRTGPW